jgi:hypothetical protein
MERRFEGYTGDLVLTDTGVRITRGFKSAFRQLVVRGDKFLPYESIVAVQFHKVPLGFGRAFGYIQLSLRGGSEAKAGLLQSYRDENSVWWDWWRRAGVPSSRRHANSFWPESRPKRRRRRSVLTALKQ